MNIFHICHVYPPEIAPAGVNAQELAEDMTAEGHKVTLVTGWPNHPQGVLFKGWSMRFRHMERTEKGYRVLRCGHSIHPRGNIAWRMWYYLTFALSTFVNALAAGPIDAILCESTPIFGPWTAWLLAKCKGSRLVYRIHDLHPESALNAGILRKGPAYHAMRAMDTWICKHSDIVATLSETMVDNILRRGVDPRKVVIARHWVDSEKIRPTDRDNPWRRRHGIGPETFVVLHAGTIGYISGAEVIIQAASALRDRQNMLFLFVGEGVLRPTLESLTAELGLQNVRFLPFQPAEDLRLMQATADVSLVTLKPEAGETSIPSKVLGYLAAGRAVIASVRDDTPTAKMVRTGDFGIVAGCQDPAALAEAIRAAADDKDQIDLWGRNARKYFLDQYGREACTRVCEALLTGSLPAPSVKDHAIA
jgi:colanic acid biosynthesis glycosyl transferase WcaI